MDKRNGKNPAVLIFAKAPVPRHCKTRMQPNLSAAESASLLDALFRDLMLVKDELEPDCAVWVAFDPPDWEPYFQKFTTRMFLQSGEDLGERIRNGLRTLFSMHYHPILIIGTDTPLSKTDILLAFQLLEHPRREILGPTRDGGYYALGLNQYEPELFHGISWSSDRVFGQTCVRAQNLELEIIQMESKRDIDNWDDLIHYRHFTTNPHFDRWKQEFFSSRKRLSSLCPPFTATNSPSAPDGFSLAVMT